MASKKSYIKGCIATIAAGLAIGYAANNTQITEPEFKYLGSDRDKGIISAHGLESFGYQIYEGKSRKVGIDEVVTDRSMWGTFKEKYDRDPTAMERMAMEIINPEYPHVKPGQEVKLAYFDD